MSPRRPSELAQFLNAAQIHREGFRSCQTTQLVEPLICAALTDECQIRVLLIKTHAAFAT